MSQDTFSQPQVNTVLSPRPVDPLWTALQHHDLPPALLRRLAHTQRWTPAQTQAAAQEYRRFVFLAATCPHPVTPSRAVDEVWHLHLTFTRDYWECLTPLLPRPLHHEPGEGSPDEAARFAAQYAQTLDAYAAAFGHPAPEELWPRPRPMAARAPAAPARRTLGRVHLGALGLATVAALVAGMTFAWSAAALWIALGVFVVALLLARSAARPGPRRVSGAGRRDDGGAALLSMGALSGSDDCDHGGSSDSGASGGGDSGGSSCGGGGCGS
ncbi:glycine-rich domain-containing protein [Deinococcus arcticus]|uniref:TIGR04222 domain-containing membrane protein n=1 Tax=Deinococcus arcticus TaxID=2136176 RepID=A0A2T3WB59_9DEIO|nr:hypothetical protein [Deinococcus arcticus]PTA69116.1 hypothetical protein C8263_04835 [Deinococcus arcticus]